MIESFTDWLGQEVRVGDIILYCAQSRRSTNMALGQVVAINDKRPEYGVPFGPLTKDKAVSSVRVQPLRSARWNQWHPSAYYVDPVSGERIRNPYSDENWPNRNQWEQRYEDVKPVTLTVISNITKWTGVLPDVSP
jgi:hypothetical protein